MTSEPGALGLSPPSTRWSFGQRVGFQFLFAYFVLYVFPFPLWLIPGTDSFSELLSRLWNPVVVWTGKHVLRLGYEIDLGPSGSGDRTYHYVFLLLTTILALVVALLWTALDRRREDYRWLARWLTVGCRYYLGAVLLGYGFAKVIKTQFPFPSLERLLEPVGDLSPMGLAWTFMGYSAVYNLFTGAAEVVGGLLLFFRRTTTLGALVLTAVLAHVAMLNFAFDIPVKLFSLHLLAMALALVYLDRHRLLDVLLLNRPAPAADLSPPFHGRWPKRVRWGLKALVLGGLLFQNVSTGLSLQSQRGDSRPHPPLYGIWEVDTFVQDGEERPPLVTDSERWRYLVVDHPGRAGVRRMGGQVDRYAFTVDPAASTVEMASPGSPESATLWTFRQPDPKVLILDGDLGGHRLTVEMTARDPEELLLKSRGFHWVQEYPFNR